jgi:tRNA A-37 threonylcarbamoyl transferase component Bud32/tetratricopeptide (TPR) repeat protein
MPPGDELRGVSTTPPPIASPLSATATISSPGSPVGEGSAERFPFASRLRPGTTFADRFEVIDLLGSGGSGEVWAVRDRLSGASCALKLWHAPAWARPELEARFRREIEATRRIRHPAIVRSWDVGLADGYLYLTMELLAGTTLRQEIQARGALPLEEALALFRELLEGLEAAHREGVIHRDVKPGNLILVGNGDGRRGLKIVDFGLARIDDDPTVTATGSILGTPEYMSPEQVLGRPLGPSSDLYSASLVLFEMLAGHVAFSGSTPLAVAQMQAQAPRPDLAKELPSIPERVRYLLERGLAIDPEERWGSAGELLRALDVPTRELEGEARRWRRKRNASAGSGRLRRAALLSGIALLVAAAFWLVGDGRVARRVELATKTSLIGRNRWGGRAWTKGFPGEIAVDAVPAGGEPGHSVVSVLDPWGASTLLHHDAPPVGALVRFAPDGTELWRLPFVSNTTEKSLGVFPFRGMAPRFRARFVRTLDAQGERPRIVLAAIQHQMWYPAALLLLDDLGNTRSRFWNAGHIMDARLESAGERIVRVRALATNNRMGHRPVLFGFEFDPAEAWSFRGQFPPFGARGEDVAPVDFYTLVPRSGDGTNLKLATRPDGGLAVEFAEGTTAEVDRQGNRVPFLASRPGLTPAAAAAAARTGRSLAWEVSSLLGVGKLDEAIARLGRLSAEPNLDPTWTSWAEMRIGELELRSKGAHAAAREALDRALRLDPGLSDAARLAGELAILDGDRGRAHELLVDSARRDRYNGAPELLVAAAVVFRDPAWAESVAAIPRWTPARGLLSSVDGDFGNADGARNDSAAKDSVSYLLTLARADLERNLHLEEADRLLADALALASPDEGDAVFPLHFRAALAFRGRGPMPSNTDLDRERASIADRAARYVDSLLELPWADLDLARAAAQAGDRRRASAFANRALEGRGATTYIRREGERILRGEAPLPTGAERSNDR